MLKLRPQLVRFQARSFGDDRTPKNPTGSGSFVFAQDYDPEYKRRMES